MITVDMKQAKKLEKLLGQVRDKSIPYAQRNAINDTAFEARKQSVSGVRSEFVNRNTWTAKSIRVDRARTPRDSAVLGSTEDYMAKQEFGGKGKAYVPAPAAAGESNSARVRRRPVRQANWINRIQVAKRRYQDLKGRGMTQAQANIIALSEAKAKGLKHVIMHKGRGRLGLYQVMGTKRKPRSRLLYSLRSGAVTIKPKPWLIPTALHVQEKMAPTFYFARLRQELRRAMR